MSTITRQIAAVRASDSTAYRREIFTAAGCGVFRLVTYSQL